MQSLYFEIYFLRICLSRFAMKLFVILLYCTVLLLLSGCGEEQTLFKQISSSHSGIQFNNQIIENDSINPLDVVNVYNGGGVGIGDFNNDDLPDIYFTGNQVPNRLYLNKGNFVFEDVTEKASVDGSGRWGRGWPGTGWRTSPPRRSGAVRAAPAR